MACKEQLGPRLGTKGILPRLLGRITSVVLLLLLLTVLIPIIHVLLGVHYL